MSTKRDENKYNVRCVGKKLQAKTMMEASLAHELFSAMPPRERAKFLLIFLVTDGVSDPEEQLETGIFQISRTHFMPKADRELYIEPPDEAKAPREGDVVGRLEPSHVRIQRCKQ